ncbi:zinc metallopeptidase [Vagococcus xieshaowenii]|uniref:Zinc metallopeptidase n=1 Tax=Vagococcus xieshaowenii TaxID=2562451 RepID=A0AAJ5EF24_9ENTE|nr:zinc metallopeptidase [Vagococcus xieshaowenii]QCA28019.1 zinc metallopeptidase [Vagococcus xieshaowenii]TFZ40297.1 zinc metallopeptidase [Vagococcus xieshaowenii]
MWFDQTYFLVIVGALLSMAASSYVQSTFAKYSEYQNNKGLTGDDVARLILNDANIRDVQVKRMTGSLTDNYNPREKTLNLSESVGPSTSVAAIGVAAHECGHAIQDDVSFFPLNMRNFMAPVVNISANLSFPLILGGLFLSIGPLVNIGILCFGLVLLFQLITLPVELDASNRAMKILRADGILEEEELAVVKKVLTAAALTYIASAIATFLQFYRLILLFGDRRDN